MTAPSFDQLVGNIRVKETECPPVLVDLIEEGALACSFAFVREFRLRKAVFDKIFAAQNKLPEGFRFVIFEAYRPRARQLVLWNEITAKLRNENPALSEEDLRIQAEKFVANPHGFGSGHQAAAAVDISLLLPGGKEAFMGTRVQEFNEKTRTDCPFVTSEEKSLRAVLRTALESEGVMNYPDEWWHFSYGDRLWAEVTDRTEAFFAPIAD